MNRKVKVLLIAAAIACIAGFVLYSGINAYKNIQQRKNGKGNAMDFQMCMTGRYVTFEDIANKFDYGKFNYIYMNNETCVSSSPFYQDKPLWSSSYYCGDEDLVEKFLSIMDKYEFQVINSDPYQQLEESLWYIKIHGYNGYYLSMHCMTTVDDSLNRIVLFATDVDDGIMECDWYDVDAFYGVVVDSHITDEIYKLFSEQISDITEDEIQNIFTEDSRLVPLSKALGFRHTLEREVWKPEIDTFYNVYRLLVEGSENYLLLYAHEKVYYNELGIFRTEYYDKNNELIMTWGENAWEE